MISRYTDFLDRLLEEDYFALPSWYIVFFILGVVYSFENNNICKYYYFIIIITSLFCISLAYSLKQFILLRFVFISLTFFYFGIIVTVFRINSVQHETIKTPHKDIIIEGKIEFLKPSITGLQAIIAVQNIKPDIGTKLESIKINFTNNDLKDFFAGDEISFRANIQPFLKRITPKGFNFFFHFYYSGIGAVGKSIDKPKLLKKGNGINGFIQNLRKKIYQKLLDNLDKSIANFCSAILLGEEKGIDKNILTNLRYTGISHNFDAGIHLPLIILITFITSRFLLNLSNYLYYNYDIKIISAIISLIISFCYVLLCGSQIAPIRVLIMSSIIILGILLNKIPDIFRSLNLASLIILIPNPEFVFHPSFQLSFVAVLALSKALKFYNEKIRSYDKSYISKIKIYMIANIYITIVASFATAPVVIYHFYTFANYSILANLVATPLTSIFIMPIGLISLIFMIFGYEYNILQLLSFFVNIIIKSSEFFVNLPYSVLYFGFIKFEVLGLYLIGLCMICFSKTLIKKLGVFIIFLSLILMVNTQKPDIIFDAEKNFLGIKNNQEKLEIYGPKFNSFIKDNWSHWFGLKDAKFYTDNMNRENILFITNSGKKVIILTNNYKCEKADLILNNLNNKNCNLAKQNITKQDLINFGVIAIYCNNAINNCNIEY